MRTFRLTTIFLSIFLIAHSTGIAGTKTVTLINTDKYNNQIRFVSEAPLEKISGTAEEVSGSFNIDLQNLPATSGKIVCNVKSMVTGSSSRDAHMYAAEWLDEAKFKTIQYTLKSLSVESVEAAAGNRTVVVATAKGEFSLHGVTKPIDAKVKITYLNESAQTRATAAGDLVLVQVEFVVNLKAHNVVGKAGIVGSKVGENITINAQLFGTTAAH